MKKIKKYQLIQDLLNQGLDYPKFTRRLASIRNSVDYSTLLEIVENFVKRSPIFKEYMFGTIFPNDSNALGGSRDFFLKPSSVESEISWISLQIKYNKEKIQFFVSKKKMFEHLFLHGRYSEALNILENVRKELGVSIWYYESKLLLYEYSNRTDDKFLLLSDINEKQGETHAGFVTSILHFISYRTARNLSAYKYDLDLQNCFQRNRTDFQKSNCDYFLFKLNYFKHYNIDDFKTIFAFENTNSLVDRYLTLIYLMQTMYIHGNNDEYIANRALYLYSKTKDTMWIPLFALVYPERIPDVYFDFEYLDILDNYYSGEYDKVVNLSKVYVEKSSCCFDVLVFYCRSLLALNRGYMHISNDVDSLLNQISVKIFYALNNEEDSSDALYNLYQKNKNIYSFKLAYGLDYFIKEEENNEKTLRLKQSSLCHYDPLAIVECEEDKAIEYLKLGEKLFNNSVAIQQYLRRIKKEYTPSGEVVDYIRDIDNAKILFENEDFNSSLERWKDIVEKYKYSKSIIQIALKYAFECMVNEDKYLEAIKFYVNNYIDNPVSVAKINITDFMYILRKMKYKGIRRCIELPIFVGLNAGDDADKSFILQSYCEVYDKQKPSELFDELIAEDIRKVECFYYVIYKEETLRHFIYINSTLDNLQEKQRILKFLVDLNTPNRKAYQEQLDIVSNSLIVYEGSKKLDDSKIFANDQAIVNYELRDVDGLFNRFKTIFKLVIKDNLKIVILQGGTYKVVQFEDKEKKDPGVKFSDNALLEVFYSIFDLVRDKFLNSKYGIVAYLSTRIRHGVLEGELRPEIDKENLIFNRINNKYVSNNFWQKKYGIDSRMNTIINKELEQFSIKVDSLLYHLIKEKLQIKEDAIHQDGLFNYDVSNSEIEQWAYEMGNMETYQECCWAILRKLWERTELNLENIRRFIDTNVRSDFEQAFNMLRSNLLSQISQESFPEIYSAINTAYNTIDQRLYRIEGWFKISGPELEDFDIETLLDLVWENTSKCYPKDNANLQIQCVKGLKIKGDYLIHFTDLFRIFLDNMFKYTQPVKSEKNFNIICKLDDKNHLNCVFENKAPEKIEIEGVKTTMSNENISCLTEGKSGLGKAKKIIKYDLRCENNNAQVEIKDGNFIVNIDINVENLRIKDEDINS